MDWWCNRTLLLVFSVGMIVKSIGLDNKPTPLVPATVEECLGSSAIINCTFQINDTNLKVNWYFNKTPHFSGYNRINVHNEHYHQERGQTWSRLTIKKVNVNDSGWYFCEIIQDIPVLKQHHSNGSQLIIIEPTTRHGQNQSTTSTATPTTTCDSTASTQNPGSAWLVWTASVLGCAVLVIVIAVVWKLFCRRREIPIYENTKPCTKRDRSPRPSLSAEKGNKFKQTAPRKSHYTSHHKSQQLNP